MKLAALCFALVGCIESGLVPCGDRACPAGDVCHEDTCVAPAQLTTCTAQNTGDACMFNMTMGACIDGVCQPLGCGNGVLTPDEVCDDGNNVNGDGCSADCTSTEICGNGKVDVNEQCDDGNTTDADGCRNNCKLPSCGDGIVDPLEECDPQASEPLTDTCAEFGYYGGTLACSTTCRFDPQHSCSGGRCGDGIVQSEQGEECDGAPPAETCVDFGFDDGALDCTPTCSADTSHDCERFGWHQVGTGFGRVAGDGSTFVVFNPGGQGALTISDAGVASSHDGAFGTADVLGSMIVAGGGTTVDVRDGTGTWTTLTPTLPGGTTMTQVAFADDGTIFALASGSGSCAVAQYSAGTWTMIPEPGTCSFMHAFAVNNFAVATTAPSIEWTFPGGPRSLGWNGTIAAISGSGSQLTFWYLDPTTHALMLQLLPQFGGGPPGITVSATYQNEPVLGRGTTAYMIGTNAFNNPVYRVDEMRAETLTGPPSLTGAPSYLTVTRDGHLLADSDSNVYAPTSYIRANRVAPVQQNQPLFSGPGVAQAGDGTWLICNLDVFESNDAGWTQISTTAAQGCSAIWGTSRYDIYAARGPGLFHYNGSTWTEQKLAGSSLNTSALAGEGSKVIAVTPSGIVEGIAQTWSALPLTPCTASAVAIVGGAIYAAGACNSPQALAVWQLVGGAWTELHSEPLAASGASLYVAPGGTVFVSTKVGATSHIFVGSGTTWTDYTGVGGRLAGTSATDVFALTPFTGGNLSHWDGTGWSDIRVDPTINYVGLAVSATDIVATGAVFPAPTPVVWYAFARRP